jgi:hypothetical protein
MAYQVSGTDTYVEGDDLHFCNNSAIQQLVDDIKRTVIVGMDTAHGVLEQRLGVEVTPETINEYLETINHALPGGAVVQEHMVEVDPGLVVDSYAKIFTGDDDLLDQLDQRFVIDINKEFPEEQAEMLKKYIGKNYRKIAKSIKLDLSKNPKNKFAMIASTIGTNGAKININTSEEFLKAGLMMKSIRIQANGKIKESMAFENINYTEVYHEENEWLESRCYNIFTSRFMFVIFREQTPNKEDYILDNIFFWTMPQSDLNIAELYWENIKQCVNENHISPEYFWKISDHKLFHVRPKGRNVNDLAPNPHGGEAKKYCYWFNNEYITDIVNKNKQ